MRIFLSLLLMALLSGCGSDSEVKEQPKPPIDDSGEFVYSGPAAETADIQQFKIAVWDNLVGNDKCGACHNEQGQSPQFARRDDINLAYGAINGFINLTSPKDSLLVTKVAGGHNCWQQSDSVCADILTTWISEWAQTDNTATTIDFDDPILKVPGSSKSFPASSALFSTYVHPTLQQNCANCHSSSASFPVAPYFAEPNADAAYQVAQAKIDLNQPELSRFVLRLGSEFHNCWSDCESDAALMQEAITQMADAIPTNQVDDALVLSKALKLTEGIVANNGNRFEQHIIAKWEFKSGQGFTAYDTSGVEPAANLTINGDVSWVGGWGIKLNGGRAQASTSASAKLHKMLTATGEFSLEAWLVPDNVTQEGPARIISYSGGDDRRNFTLGQTLYNYNFLLRDNTTSSNGDPMLSTPNNDEVLQATLQHVVLTFDPVNGKRIYVNGNLISQQEDNQGVLSNWDASFALVVGSETSSNFKWRGQVRMMALHNRAITPEQIAQNYDVGVGEKFFLLFSVSELIDLPRSYIIAEVSQFDSYSYLFKEPFFLSLDSNVSPQAIALEGIRIGINGKESPLGQSFANLKTTLGSNYSSQTGQPLSRLGSLIPLEQGPNNDEFFLSFDVLGEHQFVRVPGELPPFPIEFPAELSSDIGIKAFSEINFSMAQMTGISTKLAEIAQTYEQLKQQLPTVNTLDGFVAANQMAISQLAIKYCSAFIEDPALRSNAFADFDFNTTPDVAFTPERTLQFSSGLSHYLLGQELASAPQYDSMQQELNALIQRLNRCPQDCDAARTLIIAKASCSAIVGSAATIIK